LESTDLLSGIGRSTAFERCETHKKAGLVASLSNDLQCVIQAEPTPV
jgi:hypothetical protein